MYNTSVAFMTLGLFGNCYGCLQLIKAESPHGASRNLSLEERQVIRDIGSKLTESSVPLFLGGAVAAGILRKSEK